MSSSQVDVTAQDGRDSLSSVTSGSTLRDGFSVLGVAIRREPWVFTLSTLGSLLFGA